MSIIEKAPTAGPEFSDIDRGDTVTADAPPRCHDAAMRRLDENADDKTRADMDAGLIGRLECWHCECQVYTDAQGVVTERPYDACDDH